MTFIKTKAHFIGRVALGILFVFSGILKAFSPDTAAALLSQLLSLDSRFGYILTLIFCLVEVAIGGMLMLNRNVVTVSIFASCMLLGSTFVGAILLSDPVPCGCFGVFLNSKTDEVFLMRNILFLGISMFVLKKSARSES